MKTTTVIYDSICSDFSECELRENYDDIGKATVVLTPDVKDRILSCDSVIKSLSDLNICEITLLAPELEHTHYEQCADNNDPEPVSLYDSTTIITIAGIGLLSGGKLKVQTSLRFSWEVDSGENVRSYYTLYADTDAILNAGDTFQC